jgi:uncharacterized protein (TIRG00374 family)
VSKLTALKYLLGIAALIVVVKFVDLSALTAALALVSVGDVCLLLGISFLLLAVSVLKWRAFLRHLGVEASFWRLFGLYLVGYFVNLLMPSYIGGDVVRALQVGEPKDRTASVSATVLERYTGLAAMLFIAVLCVFWAPKITREIQIGTVTCALAFVAVSVLVFCGAVGHISRKLGLPNIVQRTVQKIELGMRFGFSDRLLLTKAIGLSLLFHTLTVVNTAAVAAAVGWTEVPWSDLFVVVPLILLVGAIPLSPQGLGIQEGAFLFFLESIGATSAQALGVGIVLRAKSYVLALLGGGVWLLLGRQNRKALSAEGSVVAEEQKES